MTRKSISMFVVALALLVGVLLRPAFIHATPQVPTRPSLTITTNAAGPLPMLLLHTSGGSIFEAQSESLLFTYADNQFKVTMKAGKAKLTGRAGGPGFPNSFQTLFLAFNADGELASWVAK